MPAFQTHTVRFFVPEPRPVHCAALNKEKKKLAVSRSDNSLELWDVGSILSDTSHGSPVLQTRLPAAAGTSIEALTWCGGRLLSTGLHGHVLDHGGPGLEPAASWSVSSVSAWCLAAHGGLLAIGAEDGMVALHRLTDETLLFERRLTKQERRIMSVAWHPAGRHLAAGSVNSVSLHDTETGAVLSRIAVGRKAGRKETLVWSVALLQDLTVVTGDSRGRVSFWDGRLGALHSSLNSHRADVLAIAVSDRGDSVFAAGVDPTIVRLERVPAGRGGGSAWVRSTRVELHVRDVRVLVAADRWLISAGVDASLVFDVQGTNKDTIRTSPLPQLGTVLPAPALPGLVTASDSDLQLWRLPAAADSCSVPEQLLQLSCRPGEPLLCAAVSADASWLAYGTTSRLRLHRLDVSGPRPSLQRVRNLPESVDTSARQLAFSPAADWLLVLTAAGRLLQLQLSEQLDQQLQLEDLGWADGRGDGDEDEGEEDQVTPGGLDLLTVSEDGRRAALADRSGGVVVWDLVERCVLPPPPRHAVTATALTFRPGACSHLLVSYADGALSECDTDGGGRLTPWSAWAARALPATWRQRGLPVRRLGFSGCGTRVLLHDDSGVCSLDAALGHAEGGERKRARAAKGRSKPAEEAAEEVAAEAAEPVLITDKYRHLLYLGSLGGDRLLAVEAPAALTEERLPPALRRKRFGVA